MNAYVDFKDITKTYDGATNVVESLNLQIRRGEFLTLLGPSGSGKTTSLMMLAGFESPTDGEIFMGGEPISRLPPQKRGIGMVFQSYALFPHMTVNENLAFPLEVRGVNRADITKRVAAALAMVQLPNIGDRKPQQLSGGQQQRIALARALIAEPQLVLMDEPLGALDKQLRDHMQLEIRALHERLGLTVVYVTHDQGEALTMSDRVAVFHSGRIQQLASPKDVYENPSNAFVASFIGENNRISGRVIDRADGRCRVQVSDGSIVAARAGDVGTCGQPAVVSIRPERISVNPSPSECDVVLTGVCAGVIFYGDHIRIRISQRDSEEIVAKVTNSGIAAPPSLGSPVTFGWKEGDAIGMQQ